MSAEETPSPRAGRRISTGPLELLDLAGAGAGAGVAAGGGAVCVGVEAGAAAAGGGAAGSRRSGGGCSAIEERTGSPGLRVCPGFTRILEMVPAWVMGSSTTALSVSNSRIFCPAETACPSAQQ